ncbi:virion structural protein [Pectobacterium phage Possum]|uniref:Putative structural protein n=1 Tax=Pectobacterium phage Possum TaxID=2686301 RepID=A0A7T0Q172_9CAUD|nr:virion structural protein [Pectobacterium phage Possum]QPL10928.1 putative structural protein [Pectobacterium phage Possum]QPL11030.1 putative internal virion protein [Pectobacterium phage Horatius]
MAEIIVPPDVTSDPLVITDLTLKTLDGTGVLDQMLATMRVHLAEQFDKERIQGTEYAEVYLGAFQSTLAAAIQFLLARRKLGLDLKLQEAQISLTAAQEEQIRAEMQKVPLEMAQITAQTNLVIKQTELADKQLAQADKQLELLDAQVQVQLKQLDLMAEQLEQAKAQTSYYEQRTITEKAQTSAGVAATGSVIGTQVALMNKQADGYDRNAEQQAAQILANTWNVRRQTDEDTQANTTNKLDDASVGAVISKLAAGINVVL